MKERSLLEIKKMLDDEFRNYSEAGRQFGVTGTYLSRVLNGDILMNKELRNNIFFKKYLFVEKPKMIRTKHVDNRGFIAYAYDSFGKKINSPYYGNEEQAIDFVNKKLELLK